MPPVTNVSVQFTNRTTPLEYRRHQDETGAIRCQVLARADLWESFETPDGVEVSNEGPAVYSAAEVGPAHLQRLVWAIVPRVGAGVELDGDALARALATASAEPVLKLPEDRERAAVALEAELATVRASYMLPIAETAEVVSRRLNRPRSAAELVGLLEQITLFGIPWGTKANEVEREHAERQAAARSAQLAHVHAKEVDARDNGKSWRQWGVHAASVRVEDAALAAKQSRFFDSEPSFKHKGRFYWLLERATFPFDVRARVGFVTFHAADEIGKCPTGVIRTCLRYSGHSDLLAEARRGSFSVEPIGRTFDDLDLEGLERIELAKKMIAPLVNGLGAVANAVENSKPTYYNQFGVGPQPARSTAFLRENGLAANALVRGFSILMDPLRSGQSDSRLFTPT